jgi:hypothetical protein
MEPKKTQDVSLNCDSAATTNEEMAIHRLELCGCNKASTKNDQ